MTHFCHSNIIPSFEDEAEWDEVDHFPYRESFRLWLHDWGEFLQKIRFKHICKNAFGKDEANISSSENPIRPVN